MTTVLVLAGGTGGHIYPALAVARELRARGHQVVWLGAAQGMETQIVPAAGFPLEQIQVRGLRGKGWRQRLAAPVQLLRALWQSWRVLRKHRPGVVLGMGGFVAGPAGLLSSLLRVPLVIHEQNAIPGLTNRLLAAWARRVVVAFPNRLRRGVHVGNPIRPEITELPPPEQRFAQRTGPLRMLVLGGSLGAQRLNQVVPAALALLAPEARPDIWHQTGQKLHTATVAQYAQQQVTARVMPYIDDMAAALAWADVAICRAGAMTISELAAVGLGAILVPYPHAVDDHQTANAEYLVAAGAALRVADANLTPAVLAELWRNSSRALWLQRAQAARAVAKPEATQQVAALCLEVAR